MSGLPSHPKASRAYLWVSLLGFFLMALLWGLGKTFILIFGAIGLGSGLVYYFQWREAQPRPPQRTASKARPSNAAASSPSQPSPAMLVNRLIAFAAMGVVGAWVIYQVVTREADGPSATEATEELPSETVVEQTPGAQADALYAEGDYAGALVLYQRQLESNPADVAMLINLGNCYYGLDQIDAADGYYRQALTIDPNSTSALHNHALVNYDKQNYAEAMADLKKLVAIDDTYGQGWNLLGNCHYDQQRYPEANVCFAKAYQLGVRYVGLFEKLGFLEETANNIPKAIEYYQEGLSLGEPSTYIQERLKVLEQ